MKKFSRFRFALLAMGITAILALTGMNLFSLYALHISAVESSVDKQREQLEDLVLGVRARTWLPVSDLWRIDMQRVKELQQQREGFPEQMYEIAQKIAEDPLYGEAFFMSASSEPCSGDFSIQRFDNISGRFTYTVDVPDYVCDAISMARTRMNVLAPDFRFNVRSIFDSYRTVTFAMFNPENREIIGYLTLPINREYLATEIIGSDIMRRFGTIDASGVSIWLDDWIRGEMVFSNTPDPDSFYRAEWDYIQRFPNMLEDWNIKMRYIETPEAAASKASLIRNVSLLAVAVFLLLGSLVFMYVTAQRERELSMRQASFLANVTHELKTPLAVMQAAGENLADGRVTTPERLESYGHHIYNESLRLKRMIEKLLDVARNEAGQLTLKPVPLRLDEHVKQYLTEQESYLLQKGVKIELEIEDDIPQVIMDQISFETIFGNLVENAVKYSPNEKYLGIKVYLKNKRVHVAVADRGMGIPANAQKLIFDKFYRVEDTLTATTKGHGLGLAIVKNLTERNNGIINLDSTPGRGSIFTISFPATAANKISLNGKAIDQKKVNSEYV
ncbi:MAG: HAMP domain-containing histidine kinase [Balneolales bacterium]|nr:HAMP domain-containing histidine kinase [Balneolales bacterium]